MTRLFNKRPHMGPLGRHRCCGDHDATFSVNLPRSTFTNRDSLPLTLILRKITPINWGTLTALVQIGRAGGRNGTPISRTPIASPATREGRQPIRWGQDRKFSCRRRRSCEIHSPRLKAQSAIDCRRSTAMVRSARSLLQLQVTCLTPVIATSEGHFASDTPPLR